MAGFIKIAVNYTQKCSSMPASSVARAFLGGRLAHPEGQNEEENK